MFNPDRVNIHELTIEEPEQQAELPFDVERDITEKDWQKITEELENNRYRTWFFAKQAMAVKVLNPNYDLKLDQNDWKRLEDELENCKESKEKNKKFDIINLVMCMKALDPSRKNDMDSKSWDKIDNLLKHDKKHKNWWSFLHLASAARIVDQNRDLGIDEATLLELKKERVNDFGSTAMCLRILDPEHFLNPDTAEWEDMKKKLSECRKKQNRNDFIDQAMSMAILAAEEVKVTDKGLEVKMRKDGSLGGGTPPLPETKKF